MKDLESTEILAKEQPISESVFIGQADIDNRDQIRVVTVEEEQNMVENSTVLSGFVSQENGPGFFFKKVK